MKRIGILALLVVSVFTALAREATDTLEVMSFNIRLSAVGDGDGDNKWTNRRQAAADMILSERPALLGLQEACPDQVQWLDSLLTGYRHIGVGREDGKNEGEMMAIYYDTTRMTLGKHGTFWLSETPDKVSKGWDGACKRTVTWAFFTTPTGREILYLNTHLDHIGPKARKEAVKLITRKIKKMAPKDMPVILTADFNTSADDVIFNPLKKRMQEVRKAAPVSDSRQTYNAYGQPTAEGQDFVIDHIFCRNAEPLLFETLDGDYGVPYVSDHYPIKAVLVF